MIYIYIFFKKYVGPVGPVGISIYININPIGSMMIHVWYIYLQNWVIYGVNVGKYSSTMDPMGI